MNYKAIISLIIIILASCGIYGAFTINNDSQLQSIDVSDLEANENLIVHEEENVEKKLYSTYDADTNAILVENNSTLEIKNSYVNKSGDSSDNGDNTDFYGTNSAILVKKSSIANIDNVEITTNSTGSNAIFVTNGEPGENNGQPQGGNQAPEMMSDEKPPEMPDNENSKPMEEASGNDEDYSDGGANATITNVLINTYKDKSRGLDATYGGTITAENVIINTRGSSCAALATDRGEGTVEVINAQLNTGVDNGTGRGSPCIYSTGNITASDSNGTAYVSQIACIEGKNSITLNDCDFNCFAEGNREDNGEYVDLGGVFIYQSMSGDAGVGTSTFNATDTKLSIDESSKYYDVAPMIHVTNTNAIINLKSTELSFGSGILLDVSGQNQWGTTDQNGGNLEFNAVEEKLNGNIIIDEISSLNFTMKNTNYNGAINTEDSFGETNIIIDSSSTWTLNGNSHVSSIENNGNIEYGEYTLYVNGTAYNAENPL